MENFEVWVAVIVMVVEMNDFYGWVWSSGVVENGSGRVTGRFGGAPVRRHRRIVLFHLPAKRPVGRFADVPLRRYRLASVIGQTLYLYDFFFSFITFLCRVFNPYKLPSKLISSVFTSIYQCISASYQFSFNKSYEKLSSSTLLYHVSGVIINRDRNNLLPRNLH